MTWEAENPQVGLGFRPALEILIQFLCRSTAQAAMRPSMTKREQSCCHPDNIYVKL